MQIYWGTSRIVICIKNIAIKLPNISEYRLFLYGLLANMQERLFWKSYKNKKLCPVLLSFPGGFMIVMKRAESITRKKFYTLDYNKFVNEKDFIIPVENKLSSFGIIDNEIVAVDYGS